ncbi:uncharacterized protein LOC135820867 [Sycon ciliatum]|uniref:uncharacterized protein LOC135820867 n=1 Tax=Sycon ciliatum TaxID=27933 RepID=UPI0031F621F1
MASNTRSSHRLHIQPTGGLALRPSLMIVCLLIVTLAVACCDGNTQSDFEQFVLRPAKQVPRTVDTEGENSVAILEALLNRIREQQIEQEMIRASMTTAPPTTTVRGGRTPTNSNGQGNTENTNNNDAGDGVNNESPIDDDRTAVGHTAGFCVRQTEEAELGFGLNTDAHRRFLMVDVGKCVRLRERPSADTQNSSSVHLKKCRRCQSCVPVETEQKTFLTREGPKTVDVVNRCGCLPEEIQNKPKSVWKKCQRNTAFKIMYKGTRFETEVDVGNCAGSCRNQTCQVAEEKCHVVKGPNGKECVKVIKSCACGKSCRRRPYKKAYREYIHDNDVDGGRYQTKIVDVGRCDGPCPRLSRQEYCEKIRRQFHFLCKLSTSPVQLRCAPSSVRPVIIRTSRDHSIRVMSIQTCACREN